MVKFEPKVHGSVKGRTIAVDVEGYHEIVVEFDNLQIVLLRQV